MAENKTKPTQDSVSTFLAKIQDPRLRGDCLLLLKLMQAVSKSRPVMWGRSIIGFGTLHYVYESGREGDMPTIAFSPRKQNITIYAMLGPEKGGKEFSRLGKYTTGKGCLYIKSLEDVNVAVLKQILTTVFRERVRKNAHRA